MARSWHRWLSRALAGVVLLVAALLVSGQLGLLAGDRPDDLGVRDGRLKPPSLSDNSVSSQAHLYPEHPQRAYAQIEPLHLKPDETPSSAVERLVKALKQTDSIVVTEVRGEYVRAEARTKWLGFVDDIEFWINPRGQTIEVRSASRLGRKDFGVNRARIEALRAVFEQ